MADCLPHARGARELHHTMMRDMHSIGVSSLTASVACTLLRQESSRVDVLISWWIALKFEEVEPPELRHLLRDYRVSISFTVARETERRILASFDFFVPYHTLVRRMHNLPTALSRGDIDSWCYVLLYSNMQAMRSADEWISILEMEGDEDAILGIALDLCPNPMKSFLEKVSTPKTVAICRKRRFV